MTARRAPRAPRLAAGARASPAPGGRRRSAPRSALARAERTEVRLGEPFGYEIEVRHPRRRAGTSSRPTLDAPPFRGTGGDVPARRRREGRGPHPLLDRARALRARPARRPARCGSPSGPPRGEEALAVPGPRVTGVGDHRPRPRRPERSRCATLAPPVPLRVPSLRLRRVGAGGVAAALAAALLAAPRAGAGAPAPAAGARPPSRPARGSRGGSTRSRRGRCRRRPAARARRPALRRPCASRSARVAGVNALDLTTAELARAARPGARGRASTSRRCARFCEEADLVKFARAPAGAGARAPRGRAGREASPRGRRPRPRCLPLSPSAARRGRRGAERDPRRVERRGLRLRAPLGAPPPRGGPARGRRAPPRAPPRAARSATRAPPALARTGRGLLGRLGFAPPRAPRRSRSPSPPSRSPGRRRASGATEIASVEGIDIVIALDLSTSMHAADFEPQNRLHVAKEVLKDFVGRRTSDRIGLVVFARDAYTQCPLTLDTGILRDQVDRLRFGVIEDGTAIGNALATAVNRLRDSTAKSRAIVLITDGDNNSGQVSPLEAAEMARALGIRVFPILVGKGGVVPYPVGADLFGAPGLRAAGVPGEPRAAPGDRAARPGGVYANATDRETLEHGLQAVLDRLEKTLLFEAGGDAAHDRALRLLPAPGLLARGARAPPRRHALEDVPVTPTPAAARASRSSATRSGSPSPARSASSSPSSPSPSPGAFALARRRRRPPPRRRPPRRAGRARGERAPAPPRGSGSPPSASRSSPSRSRGPQCGTRTEVTQRHGVDVVVALDASRSMLAARRPPRPALPREARGRRAPRRARRRPRRARGVRGRRLRAVPAHERHRGREALPARGRAGGAAAAGDRPRRRARSPRRRCSTAPRAPARAAGACSSSRTARTTRAASRARPRRSPPTASASSPSRWARAAGAPVPPAAGARPGAGPPPVSRLDATALALLAAEGDGEVYDLSSPERGLAAFRAALDRMERTEIEGRTAVVYEDRYALAAFPGFLLLLARAPPARGPALDRGGRAVSRAAARPPRGRARRLLPLRGGGGERPRRATPGSAPATPPGRSAATTLAERAVGPHPEIDFDRGHAALRPGASPRPSRPSGARRGAAPPPLASRALQNAGNALAAAGDRDGAARAFGEALLAGSLERGRALRPRGPAAGARRGRAAAAAGRRAGRARAGRGPRRRARREPPEPRRRRTPRRRRHPRPRRRRRRPHAARGRAARRRTSAPAASAAGRAPRAAPRQEAEALLDALRSRRAEHAALRARAEGARGGRDAAKDW